MLLFIPGVRPRYIRLKLVSIHHMLLFIQYPHYGLKERRKFQYITCYSLSAAVSLIASWITCFNTSHVTLYRRGAEAAGWSLEFQYITCYSLSQIGRSMMICPASFNTSHVTLYRTWRSIRLSVYRVSIHHMLLFIKKTTLNTALLFRFNTSHVTLYQIRDINM